MRSEQISLGGVRVRGFALGAPGATLNIGPGSPTNMHASVGDVIHMTVPAYGDTNPNGSVVYAAGNTVQQIDAQNFTIIGPSDSIHVAWGDSPSGPAGHTYIDSRPPVVAVFKGGDVWYLDFESNKPASPQQFFALVSNMQDSVGMFYDTVSFSPVDQTHFRAIVKWRGSGEYRGPGKPKVLDGIVFTLTDAGPYTETQVTSPEGLSTGAIAGIAAVGATVLGGIIYAATRKPRRRRS